MIIRSMLINDYEAVYSLWTHTPGMGLNTVDDTREAIGRYLARNPNTCFVAEDDGSIVGVILCGHDGRRGFIYHTAVSVTHRGQGIGKQLVAHAIDGLRREGISKTALLAFRKNTLGNAFWDSQGFPSREDIVYHEKQLIAFQKIET